MKPRMRWVEAGLGAGLAVLIFLTVEGFNVLPIVAFAGLVLLMVQVMGPRHLSARGPSSHQGHVVGVSFDDIGGQDTAKNELVEALDFMFHRDRLTAMGIRPLRGVLLTGPPGTGKTLLAKAAAAYTGSVFLAASGSEFVEMYAGVGAQRVRDLFRRAREAARTAGRAGAVIFLDEMEVLGGRRGGHTSHLEYDQTLNQLLVEMDGIAAGSEVQILVVGATNRSDMLDPALLRPGRFDRIVAVELPDRRGRLAILQIHFRGKPLADEVDLGQVATETFGFTGAHLESLTNEAGILALREGAAVISARHISDAIEKVILGEKLERTAQPEEKRRVSYHEAGHALVGEWVQPGSVASVTITPRGKALGYVRSHPGEDRYLHTREMLEAQIRLALAGAAAEELAFGSRSTGAAGDYQQAADLARRIVQSGLSDLGIVLTDSDQEQTEAARQILTAQAESVRSYLAAHMTVLHSVAAELLRCEALTGDDLRRMLATPAA